MDVQWADTAVTADAAADVAGVEITKLRNAEGKDDGDAARNFAGNNNAGEAAFAQAAAGCGRSRSRIVALAAGAID
jgi:hypothetical protein